MVSILDLSKEVLALSESVHSGVDNTQLSTRMVGLIRKIEMMQVERLNKIRSLPASLSASPDPLQQRRRVSSRRATTSLTKNQEQATTPRPPLVQSLAKRELFSPDSEDSPTKTIASYDPYRPSPDPPPIRSPSVLRNPLYDSPDPYLTGEPGGEESRRDGVVTVHSLAGMISPVDLFSPQKPQEGHNQPLHLDQPSTFTWPIQSSQDPAMMDLMIELRQAVSALQNSQAQIITALGYSGRQMNSSPFPSESETGRVGREVKFQASEDVTPRNEHTLTSKSRSFRINHDTNWVYRKEICTSPLSRSGSLVSRADSSLVPLKWTPQSNEEKMTMDQAASVIQRYFRHHQARRKGLSPRMTQQLQKVQVLARMYTLHESRSPKPADSEAILQESTGLKKRAMANNDSIKSTNSNSDLWSKTRLRIEHLRRESSTSERLPLLERDLIQPSFAVPQISQPTGFSLLEGFQAGIEATTSTINSFLSFLAALFDLLVSALRPVTLPLKAWALVKYQHLSNTTDVRIRGMVLVGISFTLVSVGAMAYRVTTGATWSSSFFYVYSILFNVPGTDLTSEGSLSGLVLTNGIFLVGILVFAVLLGMIGEEVANQIVLLRSGTGQLKLYGHILILNCNMELVPLLEQIQAAGMSKGHKFSGRSIVILAEESKEELEDRKAQCLTYIESKSKTKGLSRSVMDIHTRCGRPYSFDDLALVSAQTAEFVVLLYPTQGSSNEDGNTTSSQRLRLSDQADLDESKAENLKAATVAAMAVLGSSYQNLVVQVPLEVKPENGQLEVVNNLLRNEGAEVSVCRIPEVKVIDRLIAQTALQPGVMTVLRKILRQGNTSTFRYINADRWITEMSGGGQRPALYSEIRRLFGVGCSIIGYCRLGPDVNALPPACGSLNQRTRVNPSEDEELKLGDQLIAIIRKDLSSTPSFDHAFMSDCSHKAIQRLGRVSFPDT